MLPKQAQDVLFNAIIVGDDAISDRGKRRSRVARRDRPNLTERIVGIPTIGFRRGNFAHVIHSDYAGAVQRAFRRLLRRNIIGREAGFHGAERAEMSRQSARVDSLDAGNFPALEVIIERGFRTPVARDLAQLFDDKSAHVRLAAFLVERVGAVISDERISHRDDLAAVGRIG